MSRKLKPPPDEPVLQAMYDVELQRNIAGTPFGTVCDPPGQDYYERDVAFLLALVETERRSSAHAIAELCGQVNGLRERLEESEHAMHLRVRAEGKP